MNVLSSPIKEQVVINKSYKYRLNLTVNQERQFRQFAGCARFVYNWGLARWKELYESGHKPGLYDVWMKQCFLLMFVNFLGAFILTTLI